MAIQPDATIAGGRTHHRFNGEAPAQRTTASYGNLCIPKEQTNLCIGGKISLVL